jgi:multiple sugar transport system ATP-binding protein
MATITFDSVTLRHPGATRPAVDALDLRVEDGELLALVGPSGCGKTSTLRLLAGLEAPTGGEIWVGARNVTRLPAARRDVAMVFQDHVLYPHLTVAGNLAFPLEMARHRRDEIAARVRRTARLLRLEDCLDRRPGTLSGGQQQRVALGRAIIREPLAFGMDEPLSDLDGAVRAQFRADLAALQRRLGTTTVYVTHDQGEALRMGDRVAVQDAGRLQQVGTPRELYHRPDNLVVARFIGFPPMNLLSAQVGDRGATVAGHCLPLPRTTLAALAEEGARTATIGFRAEAAELTGEEGGLPVEVVVIEELGADVVAHARLDTDAPAGADDELLAIRVDPRRPPVRGDRARLWIRDGGLHVFSGRSGRRVVEAAR